ncbi:heavy metal translocating P-type ATPase [Aminobacter aganoensis]|nr:MULTISPECIES: cation-translocating P-type ATPase [Alphaproteobacteria]KAB2774289.1 cation-translocating P-type ATPase [Brucella anthropi]MBB6357465.1 Cd2+/Zn2+-exporting ATPase [Aminobacter aganoensis]MXO02525.1 heavy metal translocating P-type ATPase [Shinella zoogloeoides]PWJ72836.1 Cd2+/Zn2+-exporting ATPase [Pseudaminobacter salicylatoxidans]UEX82173.1 cation-translocating P-type ATPase [Shinella zoogloeoides]
MSNLVSRIKSAFVHPARRRFWLTVGSGGLIAAGLLARYGFGMVEAWTALMVAAAFLAGSDIAIRAWRSLRVKHFSIELLVTVAAVGALIIGEVWESAAVTFLFMFGGWLEARTMGQTRGALKALLDAAPATATVLRDGDPVEVPAHMVQLGETVLVRAGQRIPVDGEVTEGTAAVSEAAITGEPMPAEKAPGSHVHAGTIAENGLLRIRATNVGADTTLARIIQRVEEAQEEKAPSQRMIERFAQWYTPSIIGLAVAAFAVTQDIRLALTLLVVGCPGALVISTPVSIVAGIGRAARSGILIKGGQHLESAGRIDTLALDKTGTLTEGKPQLASIVALGGIAEAELLHLAATAETGSTHPLGRPIVEAGRKQGPLSTLESLEEHAGMGLSARIDGRIIAAGNRRLMDTLGIALGQEGEAALDRLLSNGQTPILVARDGQLIGMLGMSDMAREGAAEAITRLRNIGIGRVVMLTGDQHGAAEAIAREVGIDEVHAGLMPEDKLELIRKMKADGAHVAMVGDGINDAPALAAADTSIAMGAAGSDVAIETADIALLKDDLGKIPEAMAISRATLGNMRQNLVIALVTVAGLLAGVFSGNVHMAGGMLVHQLSVLIVIANGMRLLRMPKTTAPGGRASKVATARPATVAARG